jgi:cobalt/nickel transport system permease protein
MKIAIDQYANLNSWVHRWQPSLKLISLLSLIFSFAFVSNLYLLPLMVLITSFFYISSQLPRSFLQQKLRYPGIFIIAVVIFLPFVSGETVIFSFGNYLTIKQEGCLTVLLILTRFISIFTLSLVLFGTSSFVNNIKAMKSWGLSPILADMMLLSYRYLEEFENMLITMQIAVKLRGFENKKLSDRNLKVLAGLTGTLLVRSYEKSQRVYQAMVLRGYGYSRPTTKRRFLALDQADLISWIISIITVSLAIILILLEILL